MNKEKKLVGDDFMNIKENLKCFECKKIHISKESIKFDNKYFCSVDCYFKFLNTLERKEILKELRK